MMADPLTEVMNADRMTRTFETGIFDITPTEESLRTKREEPRAQKCFNKENQEQEEHSSRRARWATQLGLDVAGSRFKFED